MVERGNVVVIAIRSEQHGWHHSAGIPMSAFVEYDFIEGTITRLMDTNREFQEDKKIQAPLLRAGFFERLLRGGFYRREDLLLEKSLIEVDIEGPVFAVMLMKLSGHGNEPTGEILHGLDNARGFSE